MTLERDDQKMSPAENQVDGDEKTGSAKLGHGSTNLGSSINSALKLLLTMAITLPLGMITKILVPRFLGSEKAGIFFFAETFPLFILSCMSLGIPAYVQKTVPARHEHAWEIFPTVGRFGIGVAISLVLVVCIYLNFSGYDSLTIKVTIIMTCCQGIAIYCTDYIQRFFLVLGRYNYISVFNIASKLILVAFISGCLFMSTDMIGVAIGFLVAQVVILGILGIEIHKMKLMKGKFDGALLKKILLIGLPFSLGGALATLKPSIDSYCLMQFASLRELGFYSVGQRLTGLFLMLIPVIGQSFGPSLSSVYAHDTDNYQHFMSNIIRLILVLATPMALLLAAFAPEIIHVLYGDDFAEAHRAVILNGPLVLASYLSTFFSISAVTTTNGKQFPYILGTGALINLILDFLFIKFGSGYFGIGGAAAGVTLTSTIVNLIEATLFVVTSKIKIVDRNILSAIIASFLPLIALVILSNAWYTIGTPYRIIIFAGFIPPYFVVSKIVKLQDIQRMRKMIINGLNKFKTS